MKRVTYSVPSSIYMRKWDPDWDNGINQDTGQPYPKGAFNGEQIVLAPGGEPLELDDVTANFLAGYKPASGFRDGEGEFDPVSGQMKLIPLTREELNSFSIIIEDI